MQDKTELSLGEEVEKALRDIQSWQETYDHQDSHSIAEQQRLDQVCSLERSETAVAVGKYFSCTGLCPRIA